MENNFLKSEIEEMKEIKKENEFLRNFFDLGKPAGFKYILADVLTRAPFNYSQNFIIDKGKKDGLKDGDIVIWTGRILLGKIKKTENYSALVRTLFDESVKIDVLIGEKTIGLLKGGKSKIVIESISKNDNMNIGDVVSVSYLSGDYPKGLIVGNVKKIIDEPQELFKRAEVSTSYGWMDVDKVMVLISE